MVDEEKKILILNLYKEEKIDIDQALILLEEDIFDFLPEEDDDDDEEDSYGFYSNAIFTF